MKEDFFKTSHLKTRGHPYKLFKQHATKLPRTQNFSNRIINDWNQLPINTVKAETTNSFKEKIDDNWCEEIYVTPF